MKKVLILGSTGSIGRQTLEVIRQNKKHFQVVGLVCRSNIDLLKEQIKEFCPSYVGVYDKKNNLREKNIKSFYIDACHVKSSKDVHKKIFWCVPWSRQSEHQLTN